jgi:hypothetical protein
MKPPAMPEAALPSNRKLAIGSRVRLTSPVGYKARDAIASPKLRLHHVTSRRVERDTPADPRSTSSPPMINLCSRPSTSPLLFPLLQLVCLVA